MSRSRSAIGVGSRLVDTNVVTVDPAVGHVVTSKHAHATGVDRRTGKRTSFEQDLRLTRGDHPISVDSDLDLHVRTRSRTGRFEHARPIHVQFHRSAREFRENRGDRLQVDGDLAAKAATNLHRHDLDLRNRHAEQFGNLHSDQEGTLGACPDGDLAVGRPQRRRRVRLDVPLVNCLGREFPLQYNRRLLETTRHIPLLVMEVLGHVGRHVALFAGRLAIGADIVVEHQSIGTSRLPHVQHRRQYLVLDLDQPRRFLGNVHRIGRHRRHGMTGVKHLVSGQDVLVQVVPVDDPFAQITGTVSGRRHVGVGAHRMHAGDRGRSGRVDRNDAGMSMRTSQDVAVQEPRQLDVRTVTGTPCHLVGSVVPDRSGPDHVVVPLGTRLDQSHVARCPAGKRLNPKLAFFDRRHQFVSPSAAC